MRRSKTKTVLWCATWALVAAVLVTQSAQWWRLPHSSPALITASPSSLRGRASVIDGDTIEIHGQRIRVWGVDAPESRQPCGVSEGKPWRCGQQAALALSDWIGQRTVECVERDRDRYGRIVAACAVGGRDVGSWLVGSGWALDWPEHSHGAYADTQYAASVGKRGIWRSDFERPWEWRRSVD